MDYADAGTNGVCPGCKAAIVVPHQSVEDAISGREMNHEGSTSGEEPPPIPASAVPDRQSAKHEFSHEAVATGTPADPPNAWKSILPLVLLMALLGWVPLLAMHGGRRVLASSGGIFIVTGLCALFAAAALFYLWLRPRAVSGLTVLFVFFGTAVAGVGLLLAFQSYAAFTLKQGVGFRGKATVVVWIMQFAGKCYEWIGSSDFSKQVVGYVLGVGVYEELTKILPLALVLYAGFPSPVTGRINYRAFVALGFVSGLAFGASEALIGYAPWARMFQLGDSGPSGMPLASALNRWFSCVPMHALWGAADAAVLWLLSPQLLSAKSPWVRFGLVILATLAMAIVHGLYDVACGRNIIAMIGLSIGSVFLVQWIVAHSAAPSEPVPTNSSGCERPLEAFFRLPHAIALTAAIALSGFGALYLVSNPKLGAYRSLDGSFASNPKREVYRSLNGHFVFDLISSDQVEYKYGHSENITYYEWISHTVQAKYTKQSDAIRVVFADGRVSYFRFTQEGIQTEDGESLLSPERFAAAKEQIRLNQIHKEAEQARMEAEQLAKAKAADAERQRKEELIEASKKETKILGNFKFSRSPEDYGYSITSIMLTDAGLHLGLANGTENTIWFSDLEGEAEAVNRQYFTGFYIHLSGSFERAHEEDQKKTQAIVSQINSAYSAWKQRNPQLAGQK